MPKPDPFGFDLSVSASKKKNPRGRRGMTGAFETSQRVCDHEGCKEAGKYRAPKSPDATDDYFWFCKEHVREYNLKWNYFETGSDQDYLDQVERDRVWERETKPFKKTVEERAWARLGIEDPHAVLGDNATRNPGNARSSGRRLQPTERRAIEILDAKDTWTKTEIRKAYKALIKVLHPDMNGGDRSHEDQLTEVVWAWDQIKASRAFKD